MKQFWLLALTGIASVNLAQAAVRSSANYSVSAETIDTGGQQATSALYRNNGSVGGIIGLSGLASPLEAAKHGYIAQLYEIVGLSLALPSPNLNENASAQLSAAPLLDDATTLSPLNPGTVTWSVVSGPVASISPGGLATAASVYQDTSSTINGTANTLSGQLNLTILNVNTDNFGSYAGDGIDDAWQVQYFGQNNSNASPAADPDGDGQDNRFEFTAGLSPIDPNSRFTLRITPATSVGAKILVFSPIVAGRTYLPQFKTDLAQTTWNSLNGTSQNDNVATRSVMDPNASGARKIYRVQISRP